MNLEKELKKSNKNICHEPLEFVALFVCVTTQKSGYYEWLLYGYYMVTTNSN